MAILAEPQKQTELVQPRAFGRVDIGARTRDGCTVLRQFRQQGSAKALFPRTSSQDLQAVLLNTAGGVTGGDDFAYKARAEDGAWLTLATQTAERAYRAQPGQSGRIAVSLSADKGARVDWLPQETILFDHSNLSRRLEVDLHSSALFLAVEPVILGRKAMGERVAQVRFQDSWRIRRDGALVFADSLRLMGTGQDLFNRPAVLDGAGAMASILVVAEDAECHLAPLRAALPEHAGASLIRPGVLIARIVATDGLALRAALIPILELLRGAPLPTVWKM